MAKEKVDWYTIAKKVRAALKTHGTVEMNLGHDETGWFLDVTGCGLIDGEDAADCLRTLEQLVDPDLSMRRMEERFDYLLPGKRFLTDGWYYTKRKDNTIEREKAERVDKRCQICKGKASVCYPRHRAGRSCG